MKRIAIYLRCGTEVEHATTAKVLEAIVAEHSDWQLVKKFADDGYSGIDEKRPALTEMVNACESGEVDILLVHGIKHLTRNYEFLIKLVERLKKASIDIYDTSNGGFIEVEELISDPILKVVRVGGKMRKEDTPSRTIKRKYEENHKDERKARHLVWGTSIDREFAEEINAYLKEKKLTKVELIVAGYQALKSRYENK